jgi:serine/threonine protein kinase
VLLLQGTLREALDKRRLLQPGQTRVAPAAAILLLRDVAAAMLHLHSEGVIHGDLKAANVSTKEPGVAEAVCCCQPAPPQVGNYVAHALLQLSLHGMLAF